MWLLRPTDHLFILADLRSFHHTLGGLPLNYVSFTIESVDTDWTQVLILFTAFLVTMITAITCGLSIDRQRNYKKREMINRLANTFGIVCVCFAVATLGLTIATGVSSYTTLDQHKQVSLSKLGYTDITPASDSSKATIYVANNSEGQKVIFKLVKPDNENNTYYIVPQ